MKKLALMMTMLLFVTVIYASDKEKKINSKIDNVTVFRNGAQVYRSGRISLGTGTTKLLFENVSPYINVNSIQVGGRGNFIILDVQHQIRYIEPEQSAPNKVSFAIIKRIQVLEDSITELNFLITDVNNRSEVLTLEKSLLLDNKTMKGEGDTDSLPILKDAMEYLRLKLNDINARLMKVEREKYAFNIEMSRVKLDLQKLNQYKAGLERHVPKPSIAMNCVEVTVSANISCTGTVKLNYMVSNARWTPIYDIRAKSISKAVEIVYKAMVFQNTGENWNNVNLKLSTIDPNRGNVKPMIAAWYINYYMPVRTTSNLSMPTEVIAKEAYIQEDINDENKAYSGSADIISKNPKAIYSYDFTSKISTLTNIEFEIDLPYSIPADGEKHMVAIMQEDIPTQYYHYLVPKLDPEAFLIAKLTDWEELNLLPGMANIYFESTYIGQTQINPSIIGDTMELSLGRDQGIVAKRKKLKDEDKSKTVGNSVIKTMAFRIDIKNNKEGKVNLIIEDQIPISAVPEIKINLEDMTKGEYDEDSGKLKWNLELDSRKGSDISFVYSIKSDKNKSLVMN